jgi:hypothetical protein
VQHHIVEVTPVLDTSAYASGDQQGSLMTLTGAVPAQGEGAVLRAVSVVDKAKQSAAFKIVLFDASPTVASADNAAADVSDAEMADKCIGAVSVAAADYVALNANSVATVTTTLPVKAVGGSSLYALMVAAGSPTYAANSLVLRFHFTWDA